MLKKFRFAILIFFILISLVNFYCSKKKSPAIHSFDGANGATPKGTLTLVDNTLYGYTSAGGKHEKGVIFKMENSGKDFKVVYNFEDGPDNGLGKESHHDAMLYYNNALFGAALLGGNNNSGVIFKINLDGTGYTPLHVFRGGNEDGAKPHSGVLALNNVFYGMTAEGGSSGKGTIYRMNTDGSDFAVLYSFEKATGHNGHGKLTLGSNGHTLFGTTKTGGSDDLGVIFSYDLSDSTYKVLHTFQKGADNGNTTEHGYLSRDGSTLYGMTKSGGANDKGVIYSINEDGSNFKILHSFDSFGKDGKYPYGSLQLANGFLYGTSQNGGEYDHGVIFRISTDGTKYEIIHSFELETSGQSPIDNVIISPDGTAIYCYGQEGGEYDGTGKKQYGTIIKIVNR